MSPTNKLLIVLATALLPLFLHSQQAKQYVFTHFKTTDGLASTIVNNAVQDQKGFIWLSTTNGLQRYDGNKFLTFRSRHNDPSSLPSDDVTSIYTDHNHNLWVLTSDNKIGRFNTATFTYKEVPLRTPKEHPVYINKYFVESSDGKMLMLLRGEQLYRYDSLHDEFVSDRSMIAIPPGWRINNMVQDKVTQKYWLASDSGLAVYNPRTRVLSYAGKNAERDPIVQLYGQERFLNYLYIDSKRRLHFEQWDPVNTHPFFNIVDLHSGARKQFNFKKEQGFRYHEIKGVLEQSNGGLWLYGLPYFARFHETNKSFEFIRQVLSNEQGIRFNNIHSMFEDRQANIWICTDNGVYQFNPATHIFDNYRLAHANGAPPVEGRVQTALQVNDKEIWLGTRDLGLYCYDNQFQPLPIPAAIKPYQEGKSVWDIHKHQKTGTIWLGMQGGRIIVYHPQTKKVQLLTPTACENRAITQIEEDGAGNLWLGTQGGNLVKWTYNPQNSFADSSFVLVHKTKKLNKLFLDNRGFMWAATNGDGLLKFDPVRNKLVQKFMHTRAEPNSLWNNAPTDIMQYNSYMLLIAADAMNFLDLNTNAITHFSSKDGLPANGVLSIEKDRNGILWLGLINGLCRANMAKHSFTMYDRSDGILNDNFNANGAFPLRNGRMLFAGEQNFMVFDPASLQNTGAVPDVTFTDFKLSNVSLPVDSLSRLKRIDLEYNKNSIAIEFSALNYTRQNKLTYYYQLSGFNEEWVQADGRRQALYSYLPPGSYTFQVRTKNADGVFNPHITSLNILIHPPFWRTAWFYAILSLALVTIFYLVDRERIKRLLALQHVRSQIAGKLHDDVSTTLHNINILSRIAKMKADSGDIEKSKEFIDQIETKSYNMAVTMDDMLWSIDPQNDRMDKTLLRVLEYAEELESLHQVKIEVLLDPRVRKLVLDMKVRYEFLMVCKEALRNFAETSGSRHLQVNIDCAKTKIVLKISSKDTGSSFTHEDAIELKRIMSRKAETIHTQLNIEADKKETSMVLSMPL